MREQAGEGMPAGLAGHGSDSRGNRARGQMMRALAIEQAKARRN